MHRYHFIATAVATVIASPAAAQDEVLFGPAPDWVSPSELRDVPQDAGGVVFFRRQEWLTHLTAQGETSYVDTHQRLLHPQALELGNIQLAWNPASGAPTVHHLQIHRDGEVIDVLETAEFEILRREDNLEQAMLDGLLTAVLQVPDLRIDDELAFAYSLPTQDPTMGSDSFGLLSILDNPGLGRFRIGLSWEDGQEPAIKLTDDFGDAVTRRRNGIDIMFDDPDSVSAPAAAPPRYNWLRMLEYSDFADWQSISRRVDPLFEAAAVIEPGSSLEKEADRIAAAHSDPAARAAAALKLVQRQVRYIYVGLNGGNYTPASAEETWSRRYGDCKGKTALLMALLDRLGIENEAVLVSNAQLDDGLEDRLPNPGVFDHILVRARVDGRTLWMDGTLPDVVLAGERPLFPYRNVLPLSAPGSAIEAVAQVPLDRPHEMGLYDIDASGGFDVPARLTHTIVSRGPAAIVQHVQYSAATPNQLSEYFRGQLLSGQGWQTLDTVDYRFDKEAGASILTLTGTYDLDWETYDNTRQYVLPGGGFSPPAPRSRPSGQNADAPYFQPLEFSCYATTVRLPRDTNLANWGFNTVYDTKMFGRVYYRMMELRDDHTLRMVRGSRVETPEITAGRAGLDNARIDRFDNSKARLEHDPDRTFEAYGRLTPVPAVSEIDWTADAPPCLPADLLEKD